MSYSILNSKLYLLKFPWKKKGIPNFSRGKKEFLISFFSWAGALGNPRALRGKWFSARGRGPGPGAWGPGPGPAARPGGPALGPGAPGPGTNPDNN